MAFVLAEEVSDESLEVVEVLFLYNRHHTQQQHNCLMKMATGLSHPKRNPTYFVRLLRRLNSTRQLRTESTRHRRRNDEDKNLRNSGDHRQEHLYLYKSKGQHLLTNPRVLDTMVRRSSIKPTDTVLEIGPGTGNLTVKLLEASLKVVAIEIDKRMVEALHKRVSGIGHQDKLTVIREDALKAEFPHFDLVVANIPYGISSPIVAKLVYGRKDPLFRSATLLLQKEFARRLLAKPGDSEFNRLAVNVTLVADVEFVMDVSKRDFVPPPKVDSSVVIIRPKAQIPNVNLDEWRAFTRTCFGKKNKTLGAIFKQKKKVLELLKLSKILTVPSKECANVCSSEFDSVNGDEDEEEDSDEERYCSVSCSRLEFSSFKEKVVEVLKDGDFEDKRPSKLCNEELLNLLSLFNQAGVYFHDHSEQKNAIIDNSQ